MNGDITLLLKRAGSGDPHAAGLLLPLVYDELRKIAAAKASVSPELGQTLLPTALVHEAWQRLGGDDEVQWTNRAHFFTAAGEAMRQILVDHARRRHSALDGTAPIEDAPSSPVFEITGASADDAELLQVHEALDRLALAHPRKAELVKQKYFAGLQLEEAAEVLGISLRTARSDWAYARAWLFREVKLSSDRRAAQFPAN